MSACVLVTLFARYADEDRFPTSAYANIGLTYLLSLSSIGLLGLDLAFTLRDRADATSPVYETELSILWNIVYWGSLVSGTVFSTFLSRYWQSGHFTVMARVKHTIKVSPTHYYHHFQSLLKLIVAACIVFGILAALVFGYLKPDIEGLKSIALIMTSIYNMLVLVSLLGYGLFNLPLYLWKQYDHRENLYAELETASEVRRDYRSSMADFYTVVSQCKNMVASHKTAANAACMEILEAELPKKDLEG